MNNEVYRMEIPKVNGNVDIEAVAKMLTLNVLLSDKPRKEIEVYVKGVLEDVLLENAKKVIKETC